MRKKKVHFVSLGCDKNLVDSEKALGLLIMRGYAYTSVPEDADVIIINTCCFIRDARDESIEAILSMTELKKDTEGFDPIIVVMGCMAERYRSDILDTLPEVDVIVGTNSWQDIADAVDEACSKKALRSTEKSGIFRPLAENVFREKPVTKRFITGSGHYAYLKIAEGCEKRCTYCIIPYLKGRYRSVPMEDLVDEAVSLAAGGVKELILVAQETTLYGTDLYGTRMLTELLRKLNDIDGIRWIRILYCYPEEVTDELIEAIGALPKVVHYLDIPLQHASDHILRRMGRLTSHDEIRALIEKLRTRIPDIVLRTTLITGFPGESERDHKILTQFIREMEFERLGCFEYSREEGTKAAKFSHQVPAYLKARRRDEIMTLQQEIAKKKGESNIGRTFEVMIEGRLTADAFEDEDAAALIRSGNIYVGRTYMDAPDVDSYIYIYTGRREFMTGDMIMARVTASNGYDLTGELI